MYTIGEVWPTVEQRLARTNVAPLMQLLSGMLFLRNLVGTYHVAWAASFTHTEADDFALLVLKLLKAFHCDKCLGWILDDQLETGDVAAARSV